MPEDQAPVWRYGCPYVSPNDGQAHNMPMRAAPLDGTFMTIDRNGNPIITLLPSADRTRLT